MMNVTHLQNLGFRPSGAAGDYDVGGIIIQGVAGAALIVGDAVYMDSNGKFVKSTTPTNYNNALTGVVVGGQDSNYEVTLSGTVGGAAASADTEKVLVMVYGICYGIADGTLSTNGVGVIAGNGTAGRLDAAAAGSMVLGHILGTAANAGDAVKLFVRGYLWKES